MCGVPRGREASGAAVPETALWVPQGLRRQREGRTPASVGARGPGQVTSLPSSRGREKKAKTAQRRTLCPHSSHGARPAPATWPTLLRDGLTFSLNAFSSPCRPWPPRRFPVSQVPSLASEVLETLSRGGWLWGTEHGCGSQPVAGKHQLPWRATAQGPQGHGLPFHRKNQQAKET